VKRSIFYLLWLVRGFPLPADDFLFIEEEMMQIHSKDLMNSYYNLFILHTHLFTEVSILMNTFCIGF